ncbi:hypothetical protein BC628DRAFT_1085103 [Trametes gibbosa]|nr:hypothetical protein BC628DRAFT_1085103 [Trametes gibbosa]
MSSSILLPIEVYERVIDLTATEPPLWTSEKEYDTFRSCALVCRAWRPRSQWNLFYSIHLNRASQVDRLLSIFSTHPPLLDLIQYVHVGKFDIETRPTVEHLTRDPYIPFANGRLTRALRNAHVFRLSGLTWFNYPPVYTSLFRQFKGLVELQLNSVVFGSAGDVIRMAWNCPTLETLVIQYCRFNHAPSEAESARLQASRRTNSCTHLQRIDLEDWQDAETTPPLLALGDTIKTLLLSFNSAKPWRAGGRVLKIVSQYRVLESLHLTIVYAGEKAPNTLPPETQGYERETPLLALLTCIQPQHLKKLELCLKPLVTRRSHSPPLIELDEEEMAKMDVPLRTYMISRSQMIDKVIGQDIKALIDPSRYQSLEELNFNIEDDVREFDVDWWWARVDAVLPPWPKRLGITIDPAPLEGADITELWLAEGDTPAQPTGSIGVEH